jgi:glycosyltransferase 2 family protein
MIQRVRPLLSRYFQPIALVATVVGVAFALISQRDAIANFDWSADPTMFAAAVLLFAAAPLVQGFCFWLVLRAIGVHSPPSEALVIWSRSFLLRYAPSGALAIVIRVRERDRLAATSGHIYTATGYENLVALLSGAIACVAGFLLSHERPPLIGDVILVVAVSVAVALRPGFLGRLAQRQLSRRGIEVPEVMRGRWLTAIVAVNATGWLATGAACYLLIDSLTAHPMPLLSWLTGVYAFAFLLGFIVPLLPGGLGLRDGTVIAFLSGPFGVGAATAIALALRLANTLGEFVAIGIGEVSYLAVRRGPARVHLRRRPAAVALVGDAAPGVLVEHEAEPPETLSVGEAPQ